MDIDKANEQELRKLLFENGVKDHVYVNTEHPDSKELRAGGHEKCADIIDDLYRRTLGAESRGWIKVLTVDECRAKAREIINAKHK